MRLTVSIPCFGRPMRTRRIIDNVLSQTIDGWEALVIGDACPVMQSIIDSGEYAERQAEAQKRGNKLILENRAVHTGGCGYAITNANIMRASGRYIIFAANDDVIQPYHFENYLTAIENTDNDFMYFNSYLNPYGILRISKLEYGSIGHSEIIVRNLAALPMPPHTPEYGHDWVFIQNLIKGGAKSEKANGHPATYRVMSLPNKREEGID